MGLLDNLQDKANDVMDDPETREKIERMAAERGISVEAAKEKFLNKDKNDEESEEE